MKTYQTECLVIGGGLSGMMAARSLIANGIRTAVIYDGQGASPWVHGIGAPVLPEDSPEAFAKNTAKSGVVSDPELVRILCEGAPCIVREIEEDMGLRFNHTPEGYQLLRPLGSDLPRVISIGNETGPAILQKIAEETGERLQRFPGCRALRLLQDENGCSRGALAWCRETGEWFTVSARCVILAAGGFCSLYAVTDNKQDGGAESIALAYDAGAVLRDLEFIQFEPSCAVWPPALRGTGMITTMFYEGAVLRNAAGKRFMEERVPKDVQARVIAGEIASGNGTEHGGVFFDCTGVGRERLEKAYPMYVERYRRVGIELSETPVEIAPAAHTSLGGVMIDSNCMTTVPGLFACGEAVGGIHGANRIGGNAGIETLVFGKRAGESAAHWLKEHLAENETPLPQVREPSENPPAKDALCRLKAIVNSTAGVLRRGDEMRDGLLKIEALRQETLGADGAEAISLRNSLTAAELLLRSALAREQSLGCHTRTDAGDQTEPRCFVTVWKNPDGSSCVNKELIP